MSELKTFVDDTERALGETRSKFFKMLLDAAAAQQFEVELPLVADLEDLKRDLATFSKSLDRSLDSYLEATSKKKPSFRITTGGSKVINAREHLLASAKVVQAKFQSANAILNPLLGATQTYLAKVQNQQTNSQILTTTEALTHSS